MNVLETMRSQMIKSKPQLQNDISRITFSKNVVRNCLAQNKNFKLNQMLLNLEDSIAVFSKAESNPGKKLRGMCRAYETYFRLVGATTK